MPINNSILESSSMQREDATTYIFTLSSTLAGDIAEANISVVGAIDLAGNTIENTPSNSTITIDNTAPEIDGNIAFGDNSIELTSLENATLKLLNQETQAEIYQENLTANQSNSITLEAMESITTVDIALVDSATNSSLLNDMILGTDNADTITGTADDDTIYGFSGNDTIDGGAGNDTIDAGAGDDFINAQDGSEFSDTININAGKDRVMADAEDTINIGTDGTLLVDAQDSMYLAGLNIDNQGTVEINGEGENTNDMIVMAEGHNVIDGGESADETMMEDDTLILTKDTTDAQFADVSNMESLSMMEGYDPDTGEAIGISVELGANASNAIQSEYQQPLFDENGNQVLDSDGNPVFEAMPTNVNGSFGSDTIDATNYTGADGTGLNIFANDGDDVITGTAGNDFIDGGMGSDTIDISNGGADTILVSNADENDTVIGFDTDDKIDFTSITGGNGESINISVDEDNHIETTYANIYYLFHQSSGSADSSSGASSAINNGTTYSGSSASFYISDDNSSAGYSWSDVADSNDGVAESELSMIVNVDTTIDNADQLLV